MITFVMLLCAKIKKKPRGKPGLRIGPVKRTGAAAGRRGTAVDDAAPPGARRISPGHSSCWLYGVLPARMVYHRDRRPFSWPRSGCRPLGRLTLTQSAEAFKDGARDMVGLRLIIGCARAILVVATDGKVIDVLLYSVANVITRFHPIVRLAGHVRRPGDHQLLRPFGLRPGRPDDAGDGSARGRCGISRPDSGARISVRRRMDQPHPADFRRHDGRSRVGGISWEKWFRWMLPVQVYFFILALILLYRRFCFITTSSLFFSNHSLKEIL